MSEPERDFPDILNMSSVTVDGERFQRLRKQSRLTQLKLALLADVSERTVRAAENGSPVRLSSLESLAAALKVDVRHLVVNPAAIEAETRPQKTLKRLIAALELYSASFDVSGLAGFIGEETKININGGPAAPFTGAYQGPDGLREMRDRSKEAYVYLSPFELNEARVSEGLIALGGVDHLRAVGTEREAHLWWRQIWDLQGEQALSWEVLYDTYQAKSLFG